MFSIAEYFVFGVLISLAVITYSDIRTLKIDDRRNWFMQGYTLALAILSGVLLYYIVLVLLMFLMNKALIYWENVIDQTIFGNGDKKLLQWLVPGLVILNILMPAIFFVCLMIVLGVLAVVKVLNKDLAKRPGTVYISIAFLIAWSIYLL